MMEVITKIKELSVVPNADGFAIAVSRIDLVIDNDIVVGQGSKGEYVESFDLLSTQVDGMKNFIQSVFGKAIPKNKTVASLNFQLIDDKTFCSIATVEIFKDQDGNVIGQSTLHRTTIELSSKQEKLIADFLAKDFAIIQADVEAFREAEAEALSKSAEEVENVDK